MNSPPTTRPPADFPLRIKRLRGKLGLTQVGLAELMGVSFASVNRWENNQSRPSALAWNQILHAEEQGVDGLLRQQAPAFPGPEPGSATEALRDPPVQVDFMADPAVVSLVCEGERLTYGHMFNSAFASETSLIDPLPHQGIAVYKHLLPQARLRFLLADDAGAGKTIMSGLYIREMLARRLLRRVLIVPPAGLAGNWEKELRSLFNLSFRWINGNDARRENPFVGPESDRIIVSVDTLSGEPMFSRLQEPGTKPYDLVIFDEAHKLAARREPDGTFRPTDRYRVASTLAGIRSDAARWQLPWTARHLLLLTATPHMGKDEPYFYLWRLLEPEILSTPEAFRAFPPEARRRHFLRRTKEEMLRSDGSPIYPTRIAETRGYPLTQGDFSEQTLYERTTDYIREFYNSARILNRSAAHMAMGVFQRRLASSSYALICSFERRQAKLQKLIDDLRAGAMTPDALSTNQEKLDRVGDAFEDMTGDEEESRDGREQNELQEEDALGGVVATSLNQLEVERLQVQDLLNLARRVHAEGEEAKLDKLREILKDERWKDEKVLIFTEYRDTQTHLVRSLEGLGFTGRVAQINGAMDYAERERQIEFFRKPVDAGGAAYMVATDAAGEGINLQFCWVMVNYDIPWNPARLEQRMGRVHRYKQKHDPVQILNLVAITTREGRVLRTILQKMETIRQELGSDKVFDTIGRVFHQINLKETMELAVTDEGEKEATRRVEEVLTPGQVRVQEEDERKVYGDGDDLKSQLPAYREQLAGESLRRLLPGYVRRFIEGAAPHLDLTLEGDLENTFAIKAGTPAALEPLWPVLETYPGEIRNRLTFFKPADAGQTIFLYPGEPLFDRIRGWFWSRFHREALRGGVFVDPFAREPYLFHLALVSVCSKPDPSLGEFAGMEILEQRLVGLRQDAEGTIQECPVEHLLLLKGSPLGPAAAIDIVSSASKAVERAEAFGLERIARPIAEQRRLALLESLPQREEFVRRGYEFEEIELAERRTRWSKKFESGDPKAGAELALTKKRQQELAARREEAIAAFHREPDLIVPGEVELLAHALVLPSQDPEDRLRHDADVEAMAVKIAWAYEESLGANVQDVSTPPKARAAGLGDHPGFDLLSKRPRAEPISIEVKGRAGVGDVEITQNEWAKACNLGNGYWLYVVFDCASPTPNLVRVRDPFARLIAGAKGSMIINGQSILAAADPNP